MRRLVVALVVAALAFTLTACGGGDKAATTTTTAPDASATGATPPPPAVAPKAAATTDDADNKLSPKVAGVGMAFPTGQAQPGVVRTRLEQKSPMIVLFYDPSQGNTRDVRRELDAALKSYRGLIALVELDAAAAAGEGAISKPTSESVAQQTSLLAQTLDVDFTPYIVFVDRTGTITARYRGYVERGILEREIIRATQ